MFEKVSACSSSIDESVQTWATEVIDRSIKDNCVCNGKILRDLINHNSSIIDDEGTWICTFQALLLFMSSCECDDMSSRRFNDDESSHLTRESTAEYINMKLTN